MIQIVIVLLVQQKIINNEKKIRMINKYNIYKRFFIPYNLLQNIHKSLPSFALFSKLALHQYFHNMSSSQQYSDLLHLYVFYIVKCSVYVKITLYNYYQLILFYFISKIVYNPTKFYFKHIITFGVLRNVFLIVLMQKHKDTFSKQFSLLLDSLE